MTIDLFGITRTLTDVVNPFFPATLKITDGTRLTDGFASVPNFIDLSIMIDVQAVSTSDLAHVQNISQQSDLRTVYIMGGIKGLNRPLQTGGDVLSFYGSDWKVIQVLEEWGEAEWSKVVVSRQTFPPQQAQ